MGHAADDDGACGIVWVVRFKKGMEQWSPYVEDDRGKMDGREGVMIVVMDVATDDSDEDANLAEVRTGDVHVDEDKVVDEVLAEDVMQTRSGV